MEKIQKVLEEIKKNPQAAELTGGETPLSAGEFVKRMADAAQKLGYDISEAELKDYFDSMQKKVKEKTDSVAAEIEAESDDVLEEVAGGDEDGDVDSKCGKSHSCGWSYAIVCAEYIYDY